MVLSQLGSFLQSLVHQDWHSDDRQTTSAVIHRITWPRIYDAIGVNHKWEMERCVA